MTKVEVFEKNSSNIFARWQFVIIIIIIIIISIIITLLVTIKYRVHHL